MAILTANDFAQQMVAQARILDPSFSGEVGTPERKIIDTVAQTLADNQVDLTGLSSALDIDSRFGANLDRFTSLFGFQRQQPTAATGYVVFSRITPAPANITISTGTVIQANVLGVNGTVMQYTTTAGGIIPVGTTSSGAIPLRATVPGTIGNTAANTLTKMVGNIVAGVTSVTNSNPLTNGLDAEDDNSFKVRFKNTWARNLAGTQDQFLALAVAGAFTTKANVIGVQSRYQEYVQVPSHDDAGVLNGTTVLTQSTLGTPNQWTTALSSIPYAKQVYNNTQTYISNGQQGATQFYYRPDFDFQFNNPPLLVGDAVRSIETVANGHQTIAPGGNMIVTGLVGFTPTGTIIFSDPTGGVQQTSYTGLQTSPSIALTGCGACVVADGAPVYLVPNLPGVQPNFTLLNVNDQGVVISGLQAVAPGDILLSEFSYVSTASRNDTSHNVDNAVDIYVDGSNDLQSSCIFLSPQVPPTFNNTPNSPWYYENYRRNQQPAKRPQLGNYLTPLFQAPLVDLSSSITMNAENFYLGTHYWLVHDVSALGGSIRARDAIEWNKNILGDTGGFPVPVSHLAPYYPTGGFNIGGLPAHTAIEVNDYQFDANIVTLQASAETARQVTTDVLVHQATPRYFKLDLTVMYSTNANFAVTNAAIATAVQAFFDRQYFGTVIQLSTLLEIVHQVSGVDNVRWSNDVLPIPDLIRIYETDAAGNSLHGASVDRLITNPGVEEQQTLYIVGSPQGTFTLSWTDPILPGGSHTMTTAAIPFTNTDGTPISFATIQSAIRAVAPGSGIYHDIIVTKDTRPALNVSRPITSYTIMYGAAGLPYLPTVTQSVSSSSYAYDSDFFLLDHELPTLPIGQIAGDTLPGLIIRPRAQATFFRPGLG